MKSLFFLSFLTLWVASFTASLACTTFSYERLLGKSYDWDQKEAAVILNKRNVAKRSLALLPTDVSSPWTSKYASLTFNQYGQEFPNGGVNEKGLAVEIMVLDSTKFPEPDKRGSLNELQWIQYQLDNFETVKDAVAAIHGVRISKVYANVHYTMCDATGACATIEFLKGEPKIHFAETLPYAALTNSTYVDSLNELKKYSGYGGTKPLPASATDSFGRFVVAATRADKGEGKGVDYAFETLSKVNVAGHSKWNIVYDLKNTMVHFRTSDKPQIKSISLSKLSMACKEPVLSIDIQTDKAGEVTGELKSFTLKDNEALVSNTFAVIGLPSALVQKAAAYPGTTSCED